MNSERQSLKGSFILDLSRFGSPIRLDVTAFAEKVRSDKWLLLAACLLIDFIGDWALFRNALPCHFARVESSSSETVSSRGHES